MESKRRSKTRRSKAERDELVAAWRASGKSVTGFAKEHGLPSSSLYQWINPPKPRRRSGEGSSNGRKHVPPAKAAFAEVNVVGQTGGGGPVMTIALRSGHSVSFEGGPVDPAWLASVLQVVGAC